MTVSRFSAKDLKTWDQHGDRRIFLGEVLDSSNSGAMSAGFARYEKKGESNEWVVTFDAVLVVTKGVMTVSSPDGAKTAKAGEILFLAPDKAGTKFSYEAEADDTELVYVTYPHWKEASNEAELADNFHAA